jgi:hypothetical protein
MKLLREIAADCMDAYNQDYADDNETFFDQPYFERQCADAYSSLVDNQYQVVYAALRADNRHRTEFVTLDPLMLTQENVEIKKDGESGYWKAELKGKIFSFKYDQSSCGLQAIYAAQRGKCTLVRSKQEQAYLDEFMPNNDTVYYWPWNGGVRLDKGFCTQLIVTYVAQPTPDLPVQDGLAWDIKKNVLDLMFNAKRGGQPSDPTNDSSSVISNEEVSKEAK